MKGSFRTIFLDRDGVLNRKMPKGAYVRSYEEFEWLPGSREALRLLQGRRLVVVTNQRGVSRGHMTLETVTDIHRRMEADLARVGVELTRVYVCPHEDGTCDCRKPRPGMLRRAAAEIDGLDLGDAVMIGDSVSDAEAAAAVGCPCILIVPENLREMTLKEARDKNISVLDTACSLLAAVRRLVGETECSTDSGPGRASNEGHR